MRPETFVDERAALRRAAAWNSSADTIVAAARRHSDRVALVSGDRRWTFREVNERTNRISHALLALGVRPNDRVSVLRGNVPEHIEIQLAMLKLGAAMINVNPRLSASEMAWQVTDSESRILIVAQDFLPQLEQMRSEIESVETVLVLGEDPAAWQSYEGTLAKGSATEPNVEVQANHLAYIRYTSGTTGAPKGVVHDQFTITAVTRNLLLDYLPGLSRHDNLLSLQGIYHGAGWFILPCWIRGASFVITHDYDPGNVERLIAEHRITVIKSVPTVLLPLIRDDGVPVEAMDGVHSIVYGASAIPRTALERGIARLGQRFIQLYGQAESPMTITVLEREDHVPELLSSAGHPITHGQVRVVAKDDREVVGEPGEIQVLGDHNMCGYWRGSDRPIEFPWEDNWVRTGDVGVLDERGFVTLTDRMGEMIITGGLNVYPNEVEQVLYTNPAVREAAVVGVPDERWGERIVAMVVGDKELRAQGPQVLEELCRTHLGPFKCPKEYRFVDDLPKNAAGKIMRRKVKESFWVGYERMVN